MRLDLPPEQQEFNEMEAKEQVTCLCDVHECDEKVRKIHFKQYVHDHWNPHPPQRFVKWWGSGGITFTEKKTNRGWGDAGVVQAFNCEAVRECYRESKEIGLT